MRVSRNDSTDASGSHGAWNSNNQIYRYFSDKVEIFKAPKGVFDTVIKDTHDYLEHLHESEA